MELPQFYFYDVAHETFHNYFMYELQTKNFDTLVVGTVMLECLIRKPMEVVNVRFSEKMLRLSIVSFHFNPAAWRGMTEHVTTDFIIKENQ